MQLVVGIVIKAIPIYMDDEDEFNMPSPVNITFYEISATYKAKDPFYGNGTIIVSGGLEYFTATAEELIDEAIQEARAKERSSFVYLN